MKKLTLLCLTVLFAGNLLIAQNVDQGRNFLYYGRLSSAQKQFEGAIASNAANADAIYWLGQTYIANDNLQGAKDLYQKALQNGVNAPLIWVGMGHVELLEGKKNEARQRFEAAITATKTKKGENPDILNAIGRANADGGMEIGDPQYAIEKLKRAAELNPKNPEIYVNLGINYLKSGNEHGGDAYEAFNNALRIDPKYARANYRLGKIFLSQGNKEKFEEYFNKSIQADPKFAPAYLDLYNYYSNRDVNKAKEYLENYVANTDKDCNTDYFYADYLFRAGKYQESLDKAKQMEAGVCKDYPRLKVLYAYNYDRLGDSIQAKNNITSYLISAPKEKVQPDDYLFAVNVLKRFPGSEQQAIDYLKIALENDTVRSNRFKYMDTIAYLYRRQNKPVERLEWLQKSYQTNPNPSNADIYNLGDAAFNAGNFNLADSMFNQYKSAHPDQIYGYMGLAKTAIGRDKDTTAGTAVPAINEYIETLKKIDKERYKNLILQNYGYLVYVHANVQKDYPAAIKDLEGILEVDPGNSYAQATIDQIKKVMNKPAGGTTAPKSGAKPAPKKPTPKK